MSTHEEWKGAEHVRTYLERAARIPRREEGELTLLEEVPHDARRVLDLGTGDGRLLGILLSWCPQADGVGVDFSPPMLARARERFQNEPRARIVEHDLARRLPDLGEFDVAASCFAIHHVADARKRELYGELWEVIRPGGVFLNLEHVSSPTPRLHARFLDAMDIKAEDEDRSNILLDVESQLGWLREIGFEDVDCMWKWRELALLAGRRPE